MTKWINSNVPMKDSGIPWLGELPAHWRMMKMAYIFEGIGSGTTPDSKEPMYYDGEIPWVVTGDLNDGDLLETTNYITEIARCKYTSLKLYPPGTLLVAMYGATIGKLAILKIPATTNQACCALYKPKDVLTKFVFYWFIANRRHIVALAAGGGQPNISQEIIRDLRVCVPPIKEQTAILQYVEQRTKQIDEAVRKLEEQIERIKEYRQALITQAVTKGLDPNVPMKDSGIPWLGEVPEHWNVVRLKHLKRGSFMYGANESGDCDNPDFPRFIRITDINSDGSLRDDTFRSLPYEIAKPYLLNEGDILFARSGATVGKAFIYRKEWGPSCFAGYLIRFRSDTRKVVPKYIWYYSQSKGYEEFIAESTIQATIQNVSAERYGNLPVALPPTLEEQETIISFLDKQTESLDILVKTLLSQIERIQEYRQALISTAVTGQIDVRQSLTEEPEEVTS